MRWNRSDLMTGLGVVLIVIGVPAGSMIYHAHGERGRAADTGGWRPRGHAVAFVNGSPIASDDLELRLQQLLPIASYHGHVEPDRLLSLRRAALDDLILDELIYREAAAAGRRAPRGAVDAELATVEARFDDPRQFAAALEENGFSEETFRERLARDVLVRDVRAEHARQVVTDAEIASYYNENAAKFMRPESVHLLEVLFRTDPAEPSSFATAERKARAALGRLRRGAEFGALARACSEDEYRVKDGDMGLVHRGRLDAEFEKAVFAATPGRFEIARSLYGFEVFKVLERQAPVQLSLDEARRIIAEGLERRRQEEGERAWHARLLASARIEIRDAALRDARPADPSALRVSPIGHVARGAQ